jgi:hypothetical protein
VKARVIVAGALTTGLRESRQIAVPDLHLVARREGPREPLDQVHRAVVATGAAMPSLTA